MEGLSENELLELLQTFDIAIKELHATHDYRLGGLLRRFEERRTEIAAALTAQAAGRTSTRS
ncbi:MAG: hypothetical protein ACJ747_02720 [Gaiellaceae bacterium]